MKFKNIKEEKGINSEFEEFRNLIILPNLIFHDSCYDFNVCVLIESWGEPSDRWQDLSDFEIPWWDVSKGWDTGE